ncbi:MAG: hypothetical protein RIK87_00770 [Fuerstiella sp.]
MNTVLASLHTVWNVCWRLRWLLAILFPLPLTAGHEFRESFVDGQFNQMAFAVVGNGELITASVEGLRITDAKGTGENTGLLIPYEVYGDFQFTVEVRLNELPAPDSGYGTGVALLMEDGDSHGGSLQLVRLPSKPAHTLVAHHFEIVAGEHQHRAETFAFISEKAVLQLQRAGSELRYRVSTDGGRTFKQYFQTAFVSDPIRVVQVYGQAGGGHYPFDVTLQSVSLTADELARSGRPAKKADRGQLSAVIATGIGVIAVAIASIWLVVTRRAGAPDAEQA